MEAFGEGMSRCFFIMQMNIRAAMCAFLDLLAPGGRWQTAEKGEKKLIDSMKHIRDNVQIHDASRSRDNILTEKFGQELLDVSKCVLTLAKSMEGDGFNGLGFSHDLVDEPFQQLAAGFGYLDIFFHDKQCRELLLTMSAADLQDGAMSMVAPPVRHERAPHVPKRHSR